MMGVPVLSIAGSDPSGGAGIQADLKAISACGGYGMSVITALTAQNTRGVTGVHVPPVAFLEQQLDAVLADVPPGAVKIGMLGSAEVISVVAGKLAALRGGAGAAAPGAAGTPAAGTPVVLDPVMIATSGDRLLQPEAEAALASLLAHVDLVTPNAPELAALLGLPEEASCTADLVTQARALAHEHRVWVLAKAGHLTPASSGTVTDVLVSPTGDVTPFEHAWVETRNTHGTGCTLSSALATFAARGASWERATHLAVQYLAGALATADELRVGSGHGPVNHLASLWGGAGAPSLGLVAGWEAELSAREEAAYSTSVVAALASGHPDSALLQHYLGQDLAYLLDYAARLDSAGLLAARHGDAEAAAFWAASAEACRSGEPLLHQRLGANIPAPDAVTSAYLEHFAACEAVGYEVLAAALLPCFTLYANVGARLTSSLPADATDEARQWVTEYADPGFAASAARARDLVERIAEDASPATREGMRAALAESLEREIAFFDR